MRLRVIEAGHQRLFLGRTGGTAPLADAADLEAVHRIVVGLLNRPTA